LNFIKTYIFYLLLPILVFTIYGRSLSYEFIIDDDMIISQNEVTSKGISAIPEIIQNTGGHGFMEYETNTYRPLPSVIHAINISLFGSDSPFPFKALNLLLFIVSVLLALYMVDLFIDKEKRFIYYLAVTLWAILNQHFEVVISAKGLEDILVNIFILLTIIFLQKEKYKLTLVIAFLALITKETGVVVPIISFVYLVFKKPNFYKPILASLLGLCIVYLITWMSITSVANDSGFNPLNNFLLEIESTAERIGTVGYLQLYYIKSIFFPNKIYSDYTIGTLDILPIYIFIGYLYWLVIVCFITWKVRSFFKRPEVNLTETSLLVVFSLVLVTGNILFFNGTAFAHRFYFTPSLFILLLLCQFSYRYAKNHITYSSSIIGVVILINVYFGLTTIEYWQDDTSRINYLSTNTSNIKALECEMRDLYTIADYKEVITKGKTSLSILPTRASNLLVAHSLYSLGNSTAASKYYERALDKDIYTGYLGLEGLHLNAAECFLLSNKHIDNLENILDLIPENEALLNVGKINLIKGALYMRKQDGEKAMEFLNIAKKEKLNQRDSVNLYYLTGTIYAIQGELDSSLVDLKISVAKTSNFLNTLALGKIYYAKGNYTQSKIYLDKCLKLPNQNETDLATAKSLLDYINSINKN
jgi:hypothetical protein